ncbi:MAG: glycosyltransferase [Microthrixaceae bacterium]
MFWWLLLHQSAQVVQECLRSIPAAVSDGPEATTVVVDNASTDETLALVEEVAPDVEKLSLSTNDGYAAVNAAMARFMTAETDAVMVLNPDVRLEAGSIASLLEALEVPGVGIAVPLLTHESGSLQPSLRREPTVLRALGEAVLGGDLAGRFPILGEVVVDPESYSRPNRVAWATGAAMLISSECLRSVGAWDESYFLALGGDRLLPACQGPRLRGDVLARRRGRSHRGRVELLAQAVVDPHAESDTTVPFPSRHPEFHGLRCCRAAERVHQGRAR